MTPRSFNIEVGVTGAVTGLHYAAKFPASATIILTHGAGAPQMSPLMAGFAHGLVARHLDVVTFNFVCTKLGRRAPDPKSRLELCYRAAIDTTRGLIPSRPSAASGWRKIDGRANRFPVSRFRQR